MRIAAIPEQPASSAAGFPEESALLRLLDDFIDPVPVIQLVGPTVRDRQRNLEALLKRHSVPFAVLDGALFAECRSGNPSALIYWQWKRFLRELVSGIFAAFPQEARHRRRWKLPEVRSCLELVRILHMLSVTEKNPKPGGELQCLALLVQDYHELLYHEPTLLDTLLRLHEKLGRMTAPEKHYRKKIVVMLMGPYPVPPEAVKGDLAIPLVQLRVLDEETRVEVMREENAEYAAKMAREVLPDFDAGRVTLLWEAYVRHLVEVVYPWYKTDAQSMEYYCRLLWPRFLEPLRGAPPPSEAELGERLRHLCKGVDAHVRNVIANYRSRFVSDLHDTSMAESAIARKPLHKFHGSRLAKYLLLGAFISTMGNPAQLRNRVQQRRGRPKDAETALRRHRRKFDMWAWIANTEWVLATNESQRIKLDDVFFGQMLWVISEGYVKPLSHLGLWRRLPASKSAALWRLADVLPAADLPWRESYCALGSSELGGHLAQMLNTASRFVLCATKDMIVSTVRDLDIDVDEYVF